LNWEWFYWRSEWQLFQQHNELWLQYALFSPQLKVAFVRVATMNSLPFLVEELERATI
jgi:hypothetical protein